MPAGELEALVEDRLGAFLRSETDVYAAIEPEGADATKSSDHISRAAELAQTWPELPPAERRRILLALLARVDIHRESVEIRIFCHGLLSILEGENVSLDRKHPADENARAIIWTIPVRLRRNAVRNDAQLRSNRAHVPVQQHQRDDIAVVPTKTA